LLAVPITMGATNRRLAGFFTTTNLIDFAHRRYAKISQLLEAGQFCRYVGEYQNKVKQKFSIFPRQNFPCADPGRF